MSIRSVWTQEAVQAYAALHNIPIDSEDFLNRLTGMMQKASDSGAKLPRMFSRDLQPAFTFGPQIFHRQNG